MGTQLSPHFSLEELTVTQQVGPDGRLLENVPGPAELHDLRRLAGEVLEPIRELLGVQLIVTSGFRSHDIEMKVSGKDYGQHRKGQAADFHPVNVGLEGAYRKIYESAIPYDQLLLERVHGSAWIHVSIAPETRAPRRQALTTADGKNWARYEPEKLA